jgi:ATP-dependent DNA ligase
MVNIGIPIEYMKGLLQIDKQDQSLMNFFGKDIVIAEICYNGTLFQLHIDKNTATIYSNEIWYEEWSIPTRDKLMSVFEGEGDKSSIYIGVVVGYDENNKVSSLEDACEYKPFLLDCVMFNGNDVTKDPLYVRKAYVSSTFRDFKAYHVICRDFRSFTVFKSHSKDKRLILKKNDSKYVFGNSDKWLIL